MQQSTFSWESFRSTPVVAILRGQPLTTCLKIAKTLQETGFFTLEVTMNTPQVATIISELRGRFPELNVGAGTVCTMSELEVALAAGAMFVVTPIIDEAVIRTCVERKIPVFPGAYTPTEIFHAWSLGADAVKVFPASQLGVQYIKDLSGPLPQIKLIPTGGVALENIASFFSAGVAGVGMGSSLLDKELIKREDYTSLRIHFARIKAALPI
ncbi:MAG: bifunctional 4-hydroxy-2-oxoglutarate aldolase/2-dehydro-3-deoxy-phosphogluconate aldolase [Bacteroidota bacterium]